MNLTTSPFWLAALVVVVVYHLLPRRPQNLWLLLASYAFIVTWAWQYAAVLLAVTLVNFGLAHLLTASGVWRRPLLWVGIGLNVLALAGFRVAGSLGNDVARWFGQFGSAAQPGALAILLPVGMAYYTLQNISYLIDVGRGQLVAERSLVNFALYLAYFPKLLAGPIERAHSFLPALARPRGIGRVQFGQSVVRLAVGAARKLLIADTLLAAIPVHIWTEPQSVTALELWLWLGVYAAYIYNDFAGYTSLMRGLSGLFGIELSPNFDAPFFARTFSEFWGRWHITLSQWLREYVFFPLSRWLAGRVTDRDHWINITVPPLVTMVISGLWHGFSGHMVIWGVLHGLFLVFEQVPRRWRRVVPPDEWPWWRQALGVLTVTMLVMLAWVAFRLELPAALQFWRALVTWSGLDIQHRRLFVALALVAIALAGDWAQSRRRDEFVFLRWPRLAQASLLGLIAFGVWIVAASDSPQPFVYQGF